MTLLHEGVSRFTALWFGGLVSGLALEIAIVISCPFPSFTLLLKGSRGSLTLGRWLMWAVSAELERA